MSFSHVYKTPFILFLMKLNIILTSLWSEQKFLPESFAIDDFMYRRKAWVEVLQWFQICAWGQ
jgi:hypothetical protein